ncbi:transposase [Streptosporangium sp. NPDC002544]|uniref:transposase n=1 Tax=unclassified Streptosporangium TaxID=2632669 RepID=UPI003324AC82
MVGWPLVHRHFAAHADALLIEPEPPRVLGIDETRRGRLKWIKNEATGRWARTELFATNFVDLSGTGALLGQAAGRTGKAVVDWLILAAWIAKEELRALLACAREQAPWSVISHRLHRFLSWCADSGIPELLTLAETIDAWWPETPAFITTGITNARTEGTNRLIKDAARVAFGFRNLTNQRRRVRLHCTHQTINVPAA